MFLQTIDYTIIGAFFIVVICIGWVASRTAGKDTSQFFLGGRRMPWWLLGISMVACTFSADTPNLVTGFVRENGVGKNWAWWAFLITGMVTVFIYAKLWRRSKVMTDLEFYEKRYSGKPATFLRIFRSLYLGIFFNVLIMGTVTLAAIKIGAVMFGLQPWITIAGASLVVVLYASLGGLKGVIWADFFQYGIAMFGAVYAAVVAVSHPKVNGLSGLLSSPALKNKLDFFPDFGDPTVFIPLLIIPIAVQWWSVWYPGAEPGGGGYIAQRMLSAKNEKHAIGSTLLFNFAHYALRPWPWIIVALASIVVFPELTDIQSQFPNIHPKYLKSDIAYPAMLTLLTPGWLGLVVASLIAAYMSTIGTHLNWGSSYVVNDFYKRFIKPDATEKQMVAVGRICTVLLMVMAGTVALTFIDNATQAFDILLLSGAGSGLIYLLRWFWWRINAWTEIIAMTSATLMAVFLVLIVQADGILKTFATTGIMEKQVYVLTGQELTFAVKEFHNFESEKIANTHNGLLNIYNKKRNLWLEEKENREYNEEYTRAREEYIKFNTETRAKQKSNPTIAVILKNHLLQESERQKVIKFIRDKSFNEQEDKILFKTNQILLVKGIASNWIFPLQLIIATLFTTIVWILTTIFTRPEDKKTLRAFYRLTHPGGPGWKKVIRDAKKDGEIINEKDLGKKWEMPLQILCVFIGCIAIYAALFSIGSFIYGKNLAGIILGAVSLGGTVFLFKSFGKLRTDD